MADSESNHNGGLLLFGPGGHLYIGTGDGGGGGDRHGARGNAQNLGSLLGKLLRIDVRALPYTIPSTNPFVGQAGRRGEIWAYGLRNPWRFTFAPGTSSLFVADVGQDAVEEIDVVRADSAGINYGWPIMEGSRCTTTTNCPAPALLLPAFEYDHGHGCSIIGGHVYRGAIAALRGEYFFSDYCGRWLESLRGTRQSGWTRRQWAVPTFQGEVLGFGEDAAGELYLATTAGIVYRIVEREP
jgi:glucose/arabinose dehydrogenase